MRGKGKNALITGAGDGCCAVMIEGAPGGWMGSG